MTWASHQRSGYFGERPPVEKESAPQPIHMAVVDIDDAIEEASPLLEAWWHVRKHPDSPPFSGGVYDAWPARDADVCAVARDEERRIWDYREWKRTKKEQ